MRKRGGNHSHSGHKQALARDAGGHKRRAAAKKREASAQEKAHHREFASMNERRGPAHAEVAAHDEPLPYLGARARGVIRRLTRLAMAPFAIARAVVERLRDRD